MKRKLIFATNNQYKLKEIKNILNNRLDLVSLKDLNISEDMPEDNHSLEENATSKALFIYNKHKIDCFADDTGLEIEALNGEPGVLSARYAGDQCNFEDNINKVLRKLKEIKNRRARFRTIISLIENGRIVNFEGNINGKIINKKRGINGFGYDSIFQPDGYKHTFAEMTLDEKNKISHRAKATEKLANYLYRKNEI
jgi:XTP/dITP diphosphohydrolase